VLTTVEVAQSNGDGSFTFSGGEGDGPGFTGTAQVIDGLVVYVSVQYGDDSQHLEISGFGEDVLIEAPPKSSWELMDPRARRCTESAGTRTGEVWAYVEWTWQGLR
jgi:hypothetical protein